jgi:hypothetical protein
MILSYFVPGYILYNIIEYSLHKLSHNAKYGGFIYSYHRKHHTKHYPITKLIDKPPYKTDTKFYILTDGLIAHSVPITFIIVTLYNLLNKYVFLNLSFHILLNAYISDYIHTEIHIEGSWLEKYTWFQNKRKIHLLHHKYTTKNMNVIDNTMDKLLNSYK